MSAWESMNDLAEVIAENLFEGREDARPASRAIAESILSLIEVMIEDKTGAS